MHNYKYAFCVTQVAGMISAVIVFITVLKLGPLFEQLPTVSRALKWPLIEVQLQLIYREAFVIQSLTMKLK